VGYTKLFSSIVASTIWREDVSTKVVWVTMLAMKNERHIVEGSVPGLAHLAGVSLVECEASLKKLLEADPYSRNQDHQGRRIERVDGGWLILNGEYYRQKMSVDERREYQRVKQAQYRKEKKEKKDQSPKPGKMMVPTLEECKKRASEIDLSPLEAEKFFNYYTSNGWRAGRNKMQSWHHSMSLWKTNAYGNKNSSNSRSVQRVDRSIGTANEGTAHLYRGLGKVPPAAQSE
jgi:hypothetical protein